MAVSEKGETFVWGDHRAAWARSGPTVTDNRRCFPTDLLASDTCVDTGGLVTIGEWKLSAILLNSRAINPRDYCYCYRYRYYHHYYHHHHHYHHYHCYRYYDYYYYYIITIINVVIITIIIILVILIIINYYVVVIVIIITIIIDTIDTRARKTRVMSENVYLSLCFNLKNKTILLA